MSPNRVGRNLPRPQRFNAPAAATVPGTASRTGSAGRTPAAESWKPSVRQPASPVPSAV